MAPAGGSMAKKEKYDEKLCAMLDEYTKCFIVHADNVGSNQMMKIRKGMRPDSVVLMGKNTMMKRSIKLYCEKTGNENWKILADQLVGNVGLVFTKGDLSVVRKEIESYKVGAPARVGLVAPIDVIVPAGGTGMDPSQTSFFQVLNISTKINKGTVEIIADVHLVKAGTKVGSSEAALLAKLNIRPFSYGLVIVNVYEAGAVYSPAVLDITEADMMAAFQTGLRNVTAVSMATGYPSIAAVPHYIINGFKNVLSIGLATEYKFKEVDAVKEALAKAPAPGAAPAAAAPAAAKKEAPAAKKEEPKKVEEEEEDGDMGFSLFD